MTYDPALRTPQADVEEKLGVIAVEELLAERDDLVKAAAPLRARHGPGGSYADERKVLLATIAQGLRATAVADGVKLTESACDDASHASEQYAAWITQATNEKAEWMIAENRILSIGDTIRRGDAVIRYLSQELGLQK